MLGPSKVIRYPDAQVFALMNSFNLIVLYINWEIEIGSDIGLKSNKSSAYIIRCESLENGRMIGNYSKNKSGPRMDPWDTLKVTGNQDEQVPFNTTRWKRSDR